MLPAGVDALVQALQLHRPPTMLRALSYALVLNVVSLPLGVIWGGICRRLIPHTGYLEIPGFELLRSTHPSKPLARVLPTSAPTQHSRPSRFPGALEDLAGHWDVYGFIAIDASSEELYFRGVPLGIAIGLGVQPLLAVLGGTLLWAVLHHVRNLPNCVLSGLLFAWLWLSGAWYLAIAIHVTENCLMHTFLRVGRWLEMGRYPQRAGPDA